MSVEYTTSTPRSFKSFYRLACKELNVLDECVSGCFWGHYTDKRLRGIGEFISDISLTLKDRLLLLAHQYKEVLPEPLREQKYYDLLKRISKSDHPYKVLVWIYGVAGRDKTRWKDALDGILAYEQELREDDKQLPTVEAAKKYFLQLRLSKAPRKAETVTTEHAEPLTAVEPVGAG